MRRLLSTLIVLAACGACGGGSAGAAAGAPVEGTPAPTPTPTATAAASCFDRFAATETIRAVSGASATDLWAVGLPGVVLRWDGKTWTPSCLPDPVSLQAVWASGPADAWAVGEQAIYRWNGAAWTRVPLPSPVNGTFVAAWGSSASDVWLLAEDVAVHWDGAAFSTRTLADMRSLGFPFGAFRDAWGTGPKDVWIVADRGTLHWDGEAWWGSLAAPEQDLLSSVWAGGAADAWTVGVSLDGGGAAWRWGGEGWRADAWLGAAAIPLLESVRGAATGEVFFQTPDDLVVRTASATRSLRPPAPPAGAPFVASATDVWLPDALGIARWDGAGWTRSLAVPR